MQKLEASGTALVIRSRRKPLELRHLRYFVALAESLNFTRAAERVHVTQSTLSHQIRQLEEEVGKSLFDRIGRKVVMTEAGEAFLVYASRALREIDTGLGALRDADQQMTGTVRVGATHTFSLGFIPACAAAFMRRHPTVRMVVRELAADAICDQLLAGELDLGIAYSPGSRTELRFEALYEEEMVLVVGRSHPYAHRKRVRMIELHGQKMALLPAQFATRNMLEECFRVCGARPLVVAEIDSVAPMLGLVAESDIAAIVARDVVDKHSGLCCIALESPMPVRTPGILWRRDSVHSLPVQSFSAILRQLAHSGKSEVLPA
jgi:LysR family cyn operon transcriptional activator